MTVREAAEKYFGNKIKDGLIGLYEKNEDGSPKPIYPDFADEMVDLYGNEELADHFFVGERNVLVIELKAS